MAIYFYDGFFCSGDTALGNYYGSFGSDMQKHNALKIWDYLTNLGWAAGCVAGIIGNMQIESSVNPGLIEGNGRRYCPDRASILPNMTNQIMLHHYRQYWIDQGYTINGNPFGMGLVQWTGPTQASTVPYGQKLVSHAIRHCNDLPWYYGESVQLNRIEWECANDAQWQTARLYNTQWYWSNFITNNSPEQSAHIWMVCYERPVFSQTSLERRQANARRWYDWLITDPPDPYPDPDPPIPPEPPQPPEPGFFPFWMLCSLSTRKKGSAKNVKKL